MLFYGMDFPLRHIFARDQQNNCRLFDGIQAFGKMVLPLIIFILDKSKF